MCYLITFAVPGAVAKGDCPRHLHVDEFANCGGGHTYGRGLIAYSLTSNGCSCDLVDLDTEPKDRLAFEERLRIKYKKKGWSEAKIDRAVTSKLQAEASLRPMREDVELFLGSQLRKFGEMQLLVHWHSGRFNSEYFEVRDTVEVECSARFHFKELRADTRYVCRI